MFVKKSKMNKRYNYLKSLVDTMGVSGNEKAVTTLLEGWVSPYVDDIEYDALGNLIAHKKGNGNKVMLVAHADEIGFIVKYIDKEGFVYIQEVGGIDTNLLPGREVVFFCSDGTEKVGVIGKCPVHLQDKGKAKDIECSDLWVDFGASAADDDRSGIDVGCYGSYMPNFTEMENGIVKSKALDDRCGLAVLLEVLKGVSHKTIGYDLYVVCSVQEELGARGARTAAAKIEPDIAIAIDVTHATDYPTMSPIKNCDLKLGKGCVLTYGPNIDKTLNDELLDASHRCGAEIQKEANPRPTGTDINPIQICNQGVRTALVSIPCRYMHTPVEMISLHDIDNAKNTIIDFLTK